MNHPLVISTFLGAALLAGLSVYGCFGITEHLIEGIDHISAATVANENKVGDAAESVKGTTVAATETLQAASQTLGTLNPTIASAKPVLDHLDAVVVGLSRECVPGPCGLLPDIAKLLNTIRGTAGQVEIAARHENKNLTILDGQEATLFADTHTTFTLMNGRLSDPRVDALLTHVEGTAAHVDGITGDLQYKAHQLLHPDKVKMTKSAVVWATMEKIHEMMPPLF